jgi:hypothetical protein
MEAVTKFIWLQASEDEYSVLTVTDPQYLLNEKGSYNPFDIRRGKYGILQKMY